MGADSVIVIKSNLVAVLELRRLLYAVKDLRPDICVRFRLIGQMWQTNFLQIISLTEKGVTLNDENGNKLVFIQDLADVMQFELDYSFQQYQAHCHYLVDPVPVY
jgi:hypothetical protein